MKMNKVLGAALLAGALSIVSALSVFAADSFTVGKPIDLATGSEAATLTSGMKIALPIDINTDSGKLAAYGFFVKYDEALTPGVVDAELTDDEYTNADSLGVIFTQGEKDLYIDGVFSEHPRTHAKTAKADVCNSNPAYGGNEFMAFGVYNTDVETVSGPEFYLLFTVSGAFDSNKLNASLVTIDEENTVLKDTNDKAESLPAPAEVEKANACAAAFKLVFDPDTMETYIHSLKLTVNGKDCGNITEYVENGTKIEFPVRLIGTATEVKVAVVAEVGTKDEVKDTETVLPETTLTLNPSEYAEF